MDAKQFFGKEKIGKVLLKLAPPVMLAQLIQALYNIVDSLFVGRYSDAGLTALSIVYPLQLLMIALAVGAGVGLMALGTVCFLAIPGPMLRVFTSDEQVIEIGTVGFRFVGVSFIPLVTSLIFPVFFQAVGSGVKSSLLTVLRTVVLFVPLGYAFSRFGLTWFWLTFPVTETVVTIVGFIFYKRFMASARGGKLKAAE